MFSPSLTGIINISEIFYFLSKLDGKDTIIFQITTFY